MEQYFKQFINLLVAFVLGVVFENAFYGIVVYFLAATYGEVLEIRKLQKGSE